MGLFSSKKTTYVSSVAYNMAGEEDGRTNYLQTLIVQNVVSGTDRSIADSVTNGLMNGPQMDLRAFYRWAKTNYTTVGLPTASINGAADFDTDVIADELPTIPGKTPYVITVSEQSFDYSLWAERYILENNPSAWGTAWEASIDENNIITITYADNTTDSFLMTGFDKSADYLYILYAYSSTGTVEDVVTGTTHTLAPSDNWPSTSGWTTVTDTSPTVPVSLDKTVTTTKTYSDGTPDEETETITTTTQTYVDREAYFTKSDAAFQDPEAENTRLIVRKHDLYFMTNYSINTTTTTEVDTEEVDGVTITTTTVTKTEALTVTRSYREDYQDTAVLEYSNMNLWLYRLGSNLNMTLEDMVNNPVPMDGDFYPCIPVRYENKFISETYRPTLWEQTQKAYKKATKKKISSLIDSLEDNDDLGDIDFAFVHFGVSLNVQEKQCKKYLFKFFSKLMAFQQYGQDAFNTFITRLTDYNNAISNWAPFVDPETGNTVYPPVPSLPSVQQTTVRINSEGTEQTNFDIRLIWNYITHTTESGVGKAGAVQGDLWFEVRPTSVWNQYIVNASGGSGDNDSGGSGMSLIKGEDYSMENVRLYWQTSANTYEYLDIYGLIHQNVVYNGKSVYITSKAALEDEDESGFVVPLHYQTMKEMSLAASNQMSTACVWMVFNCYQIVKQKWYQTGIFKIILVVVIAIVSAVFTGGAGIGILGANLSVGSALGFSGITAAIVGSVANALAAVVITSLIDVFATAVFGEQFGAIIGAVLSFVVINVAMTFQMSGQFGLNWGDMMKADNLLKLTDAVSQGYSAYMNSVNQGIYKNTQQLVSDYETKSKEISAKFSEVIGYSNIAVNAGWWTNSAYQVTYEPSSSFLSRTLMTGTDIANMSMDMVTDYVDINLTLQSVYG